MIRLVASILLSSIIAGAPKCSAMDGNHDDIASITSKKRTTRTTTRRGDRYLRVPLSLKNTERQTRHRRTLASERESLRLLLQEEEEEFWTKNFQIFSSSMGPTVTDAPTAAPTAQAGLPPPPICQNLLWSDEFDASSLNETVWSYDMGMGTDGWGNLELQSYTRENVRLEDGHLIISVTEDHTTTTDGNRSFASGRIRTEDNVEVLYGNVEARIQIPSSLANGLWPAFWSLGQTHREAGWPEAGEIDIFEMGSAAAIADNAVHRRVTSATFWENDNQQRASYSQTLDTAPRNLNDGQFHIYRMEWTSSRITTFVDDTVVMEFDIAPELCTDCTEFHQPHFLLLNVAVGGLFPQILQAEEITAPLPAEMVVDYVRICDNGETVLRGSTVEETIDYGFDCGLPGVCTTSALNNYALDAKCGDRIQFLLGTGLSETQACEQVASTEFPDQCGVCFVDRVDCGVPETCTPAVLDADAGGFPCGDRIEFLISQGQSERGACRTIAVTEFSAECRGCAPPADPIDCGVPETCTETVLANDADGFSCNDRISFLISQGQSQLAACDQVAVIEFPSQCGPCAPPPLSVDCSRPDTCTRAVLSTDAEGFSCNDRIDFLINSLGQSEAGACKQIAAVEFPSQCGGCNPNQ